MIPIERVMGQVAEAVMPEMLTRREVAQLLRYQSSASLTRALPTLLAAGMPKPFKRGNVYLWNAGRLMAWIASREKESG